MQLSKNFTLEEFTSSDTATRMNINNDLPVELYGNAKATADMMERIRDYLSVLAGKEVPIIVTSGYRSERLNLAVGSKPTSDHRWMRAIDFKAPKFGTPTEVCMALAPHVSNLCIGQLINEFPSKEGGWVHVSTRTPDILTNRIITINHKGVWPGVMEA